MMPDISSCELHLLLVDMDYGPHRSVGHGVLRLHPPRQSAHCWDCIHGKFDQFMCRQRFTNWRYQAIALFGMLR